MGCPYLLQLPEEDERNGVIVGYTVEYRLILPSLERQVFTQNISLGNDTSPQQTTVTHLLSNLQRESTYEVHVAALTGVGVGPYTGLITVVTVPGQQGTLAS